MQELMTFQSLKKLVEPARYQVEKEQKPSIPITEQ